MRAVNKRIFVVVVVISIVLAVAGASLFVTYSVSSTLSGVPPPVIFQDPNTANVTVTLTPYSTNASITALFTPDVYDIVRLERSAIYWTDFTTSEIQSGNMATDFTNLFCIIDDTNGFLLLYLFGFFFDFGSCYAYFTNFTIPPNTTVYMSYITGVFSVSNVAEGGFGGIAVDASTLDGYVTGGLITNSANVTSGVMSLTGENYQLLSSGPSLLTDTVYLFVTEWNNATNETALWLTPTLRISAVDNSITPSRVGFVMGIELPQSLFFSYSMWAGFDNVVVSFNREPWIVIVNGLQQGYTVLIRDANNNVVASATADSTGTAVINLWSAGLAWFAIPNATVEIQDQNANTIVAKQFTYVVGGDVYTLVFYVTPKTVLQIVNNNAIAYTARLTAQSVTVQSGLAPQIIVYLDDGNTQTAPITVNNGLITSSITSYITLQPGTTVSVVVDCACAENSVVILNMTLEYTTGSATVSYPVQLRVES